jgi:hypothetical protein
VLHAPSYSFLLHLLVLVNASVHCFYSSPLLELGALPQETNIRKSCFL